MLLQLARRNLQPKTWNLQLAIRSSRLTARDSQRQSMSSDTLLVSNSRQSEPVNCKLTAARAKAAKVRRATHQVCQEPPNTSNPKCEILFWLRLHGRQDENANNKREESKSLGSTERIRHRALSMRKRSKNGCRDLCHDLG